MTAEEFLAQMADTANRHDFGAHMNLISKQVKVFGVPDFEEITYEDWFNQCQQEFKDKLLVSVSYQGLQVLAEAPDKIMFAVIEKVIASDGKQNINCVEFFIEKEEDEQWRVVQERILSEDEAVIEMSPATIQ